MIAASSSVYELAEHWLAAMGSASLYGGIVLGLVWVACRCFSRLPSRYRCWLWRLAFLKLLLCISIAGTLDLAVLPRFLGGSSPAPVENNHPGARPAHVPLPGSVAHSSPERSPSAAPDVPDPHTASASASSGPAMASVRGVAILTLFGLWAVVVLGLGGLMIVRVVAARRWRRRCILIKDPEILTLGERLARQFGLLQPPLLFRADFCHSPVVFGAVRTAIVLPDLLVEKMKLAEMRMVLAHEMAHIRRGDLLGNWFVSIVSGLFFFHPLVWLAFREIRLTQETACDELALGQAGVSIADYGNLIVDLATRCCRPTSPIVAVGIVESFQNSLKRRLRAMKDFGTESLRMVVLFWLLAAIVVLGLLPWRVVAQATEEAEEAVAEKGVLASNTSGNYTVSVDGVRRGGGRGIETRPSGFPMTPQKTSHDEWSEDSSKRNTKSFRGGGRAETMTSTSASGSGASMGGGWAGGFKRPNLILDVKVERSRPPKRQYLLCEVNGKVHAEDDQGNTLESPGMPASMRLRLPGVDYPEGSGRTAIHLFRPKASAKARYLRSVEGEMLVVEAKRSDFVFQGKELSRATSKDDNGVTVQLMEVNKTPQGIDVKLAATPPPLKNSRDPFERMQRLMASHARLNVTLEDTKGGTYQPTANQSSSGGSMSSGGGSGGTAWSSGGRSGGTAAAKSRSFNSRQPLHEKYESSSAQEFHFETLPKGAKLKAVRCTITDRVAEPKAVAFRLEEIELPKEATP